MSIFRVEKNNNYTVISNFHLRDRRLSLKTIGLLSLILSLPENWDYSEAGLAAICKDGKDSISSGLKELEKYGYLERERERGEGGRICGMIYRVYEVPKEQRESNQPLPEKPRVENPFMEKPSVERPMVDAPVVAVPSTEVPLRDKPTQIKKDIPSKKTANTERTINPSIKQSQAEVDRGNDRWVDDEYENCIQCIHDNISYDFLKRRYDQYTEKLERDEISVEEYERMIIEWDIKRIDQVVGYMVDILISQNEDPIKIGDVVLGRAVVRSKLKRAGMMDIRRVVRELNINPSIKNPKKYAISMLYNL